MRRSSKKLSPTPDQIEPKKKKRTRLKPSFRRHRQREAGYAKFYSDVMGIMFLEIENAKDLPPERNMTRTGFDMDPFVIISYGISTFRTRAIRHNLNPVWNEKLFFHVRNTQSNYKIKFAVYDKDKFSGNDFVASQELTINDIIQNIPTPVDDSDDQIEHNMGRYTIPLVLANSEKWKDSLSPTLTFRAKFVPYLEIRRKFWVALAKTCDSDGSGTLSRLEVQTMLEALGSTISESTLDQFWADHGKDPSEDLTMEELIKSLESFLLTSDTIVEQAKDVPVDAKLNDTVNPFFLSTSDDEDDGYDEDDEEEEDDDESEYFSSTGEYDEYDTSMPITDPPTPDDADMDALAEAEGIQYINGALTQTLQLEDGSHSPSQLFVPEKVIRLTECPICHKPNLLKRGQMDIVTHVATCAANDWTTVDRFLMSNYGSEAQAQRK